MSIPWENRRDVDATRLINKAFNECVGALLFQEFNATITNTEDGSQRWAARTRQLSRSPLADHIELLKVGFGWDFEPAESDVESYLFEAADVVPALVHACKKLRILDIRAPSVRDDRFDLSPGAVNYQMFMKTLDHIFRLIYDSTDRTRLDSISISLPLAHDYIELTSKLDRSSCDASMQSFSGMMQSIRHLSASISDFSGQGGGRYVHEPTSSGQHNYPNQVHQQHFWDFIRSATNLRSLCLRCTHILDFDQLRIDHFTSLRELSLARVQMSQKHLLDLVAWNSSTLRAIEFQHVQLDSGTWQSTLLHLCSLSRLDHFFVDSCGYTSTGASSMYENHVLPELDNPLEIESVHSGDFDALGRLQRHVNAVRTSAGLPLYTERDYRYLEEFL